MSKCFSGVTNHAKQISQMFVGVEKQIVKNFSYTGTIEEFVAPKKGTYKLEVWGAQGGNSQGRTSDMSSLRMFYGGYGGYSVGEVELEKDDKLYIVVGQQPGTGKHVNPSYNGGGGSNGSDNLCNFGGGGGATHIAKVTGVLSELEHNIDDILIVAGGGSGALAYYAIGYRQSSGCCTGCSGGGYAGTYMTKMNNSGNQTTGYSFGKGSGESESYAAGGGGGFYGGRGGYSICGSGNGGGGSGYIANPLLTNKKMCVCITDGNYAWSGYSQPGDMSYTVPTSDEPDIKTVRVDDSWHSSTPTAEYAKEGHGYARITYTDGVAKKIKKAFTSVNGIAKKIYNYVKTILLDYDNSIIDSYISDFVTFSDNRTPFVITDNILTVSGSSGHSQYCTKKGFTKGDATKMYIDIEGTNVLRDTQLYVMLSKQVYTKTDLWSVPLYTIRTLVEWQQYYTPFSRQVVELSLDGISSTDVFYIGVHKADMTVKVRKIWFDGEINKSNS